MKYSLLTLAKIASQTNSRRKIAKLKNLWPTFKIIQQLVLTSQTVITYTIPKLAFIGLLTSLKVGRIKPLLKVIAWTFGLFEAGLAVWQTHQRYRTGTPLQKAVQDNGLRLIINLSVLSLQLAAFALVVWPLALLLAILIGLVGLVGQIGLNLWLLVGSLKARPPSETAKLFQEIRQMQNLEKATTELKTQLAIIKKREVRFDLRFYLGWAETYQGHQALATHDWQTAVKFYQTALVADPSNPAAHAMLTLALSQQGNFQEAINQYNLLARQVKGEGVAKTEPILWSRHLNETSSEHEINAGTFQLGVWLYARLNQAVQAQEALDTTGQQKLQQELVAAINLLPNRTIEEMHAVLVKKMGGSSLGALNVLAAGPYRAPANPLEYLMPLTTLSKSSKTTPTQESLA